MNVRLTKPEVEEYVKEQVEAGKFITPDAVVEDALLRVMNDAASLTDEDIAAIQQAEAELDRSEGIDFDTFAAKMRK